MDLALDGQNESGLRVYLKICLPPFSVLMKKVTSSEEKNELSRTLTDHYAIRVISVKLCKSQGWDSKSFVVKGENDTFFVKLFKYEKMKENRLKHSYFLINELLRLGNFGDVVIPKLFFNLKTEFVTRTSEHLIVVLEFISDAEILENEYYNFELKIATFLYEYFHKNSSYLIEKLVKSSQRKIRKHDPNIVVLAIEECRSLIPLSEKYLMKKEREIRKFLEMLEELIEYYKSLSQHNKIKLVLCHTDLHGWNTMMGGKSHVFYLVDNDDLEFCPFEKDLIFFKNLPEVIKICHHEDNFDRKLLIYFRYTRVLDDLNDILRSFKNKVDMQNVETYNDELENYCLKEISEFVLGKM